MGDLARLKWLEWSVALGTHEKKSISCTEGGAKIDFPFLFGTSGFPPSGTHKVAEVLGLFGGL